ncbi:MAG: glutamine-hydrolyzing carbamoyl-phosphate synthase small subunit [Oscillospiraceae bacterium]|jgi:carbamoyl-phosphate synthase small subunit|nr:glutamine-hydrolyzing carbamoyl-phosphate synthase small subunit [Oscillospiraceae bacterium]
MPEKKIIFENGESFVGEGFGANKDALFRVVFNTSVVGYQEILSDPSYYAQIVCMTYPLIGNYGLTDDDYENSKLFVGGFIVREHNDKPSNYRSVKTLDEVLEEYEIPGVFGVDTRKITRMLRDEGNMRALITSSDVSVGTGVSKIKNKPELKSLVKMVTCKKIWQQKKSSFKYTIVVLDCGTKFNIIRMLQKRRCKVVVVPYNTEFQEIFLFKPNGVLISNGPGDPRDLPEVVRTIKKLQGKVCIFGICLGHQLIALANGAKVYEMKFGHRGSNHPVRNLITKKIEITSQNHSYSVDKSSLINTRLELTHENLLDNEVEGLRITKDNIFSVQYHPEHAPGPHDSEYLFDEFKRNMDRVLLKKE